MAVKTPRALVAGNWKMNGTYASLSECRALNAALKGIRLRCEVMICPPATLLHQTAKVFSPGRIMTGGQDCHADENGAHTGDISAEMLADAGAGAVIVGHSERRAAHGESNKQVKAKAEAAHRAGLVAIICVGETLKERKSGAALRVVSAQLKGSLPGAANARNTVIAYEPVWAIGSGLTAGVEDVRRMHAHLRKRLAALAGAEEGSAMRILYGGSVKAANAAELMAVDNVNGALVGGASLKAADFAGIVKVYS